MKIAVFVDYWNLQLTINDRVSKAKGVDDYRVRIDWRNLGHIFAKAACGVLGCEPAAFSYEGNYIYTSFNPATDTKFKVWATGWLDRQPGVNVQIRERRPKAPPKCPVCHRAITHCPHDGCKKLIKGTVEKGIDTLLATDLIRLAISNTYDAAVLASSDADMVPAVEFVQTMGKKIIQAGFPPSGIDLATQCWGSFDVMKFAEIIDNPNAIKKT